MAKDNKVQSILSDDQEKALQSSMTTINRMKNANKANSEKVNLSQCSIYATLLSTSAIISQKTKMHPTQTAGVKAGLVRAGFTTAQEKKKSDKLSWLHQYLVISKDAFAGKNDIDVDYILSVMSDHGITSESKLMEICNPNKEPSRDKFQKVIDATVGVPAKCGTKYKGGWSNTDDIDELIKQLKVAQTARRTFEQEVKKGIEQGKKAGEKVKEKQKKTQAVVNALSPTSTPKSTTNVAFN